VASPAERADRPTHAGRVGGNAEVVEVRPPSNVGDPQARYDRVTVSLHWLIAALVAVLAPLGITLRGLPFPSEQYDRYHMWHRSLGEIALLAVLAYLGWRARRRDLTPLADARWRQAASRWVQRSILLLLVVVPLSKLARGAFGIGWAFFMVRVPTPLPQNPAVSGVLTVIHDYGAFTLLALVAMHALAAVWHAIFLRDGVFRRMSFGPATAGDPIFERE
jgi:cytochrome b561